MLTLDEYRGKRAMRLRHVATFREHLGKHALVRRAQILLVKARHDYYGTSMVAWRHRERQLAIRYDVPEWARL